jgi:signal transduction histidine kinase/DNA-binding response OmpR family regulator
MFVVAGITFGIYAYLEKQVDHANDLRLQSFLLADGLRQSSDDLTRMVRTYVVTGDTIYKQHYQEILDIRDGRKPRPVAYNDIYWDLVLSDDQRPRPSGQAVPLLELMRQADFSESEFARLAQAKANSDLLTRTEFAAMALIESTTPTTEANRLKATRMLNDESYHQAKYGIMHPISEFYQMVEQRTLKAVRAAEKWVTLVRVMFIAFGLLLAYTLWRAYWTLLATLGCSVDELQGRIARLGRGDFSSGIPVAPGMESSVLGWLSATQINLAQIDAERKQAEKRIVYSESLFRGLFENMSSGVAVYAAVDDGEDFIFRDFNRAAELLENLKREDVIDKRLTECFPGVKEFGLFAVLQRVWKTGVPEHFPVSIYRDIHISAWRDNHVYRLPSGEVVAVYDDVTARMRAEEELLRYKDNLEEEVQQRTVDLVLARNAAEAANRAKSVFLSNMSHELRTPLNAILGFSNMMCKDPLLSKEQRENLDIINRSGEHLLALINDALEMAKIEAGRVQLESASFDLGGLVRDVTDMIHVHAQEKGLQLLIDQSSELPRYIKGDEARLRQMLINLVGNAVKFTRQGGVTVRFGMKPHTAQQRLLIEVEDSGSGIKPEDQQKIFEPFVQSGETAMQTGTGLGLTITRQYVQLMGGTISVESTPGTGSIFRVELPVDKVAATDVVKPESVDRGNIVSLAPNQPEYRILIVEDRLDNQLLLAKLMKNVGFPVKVAENGEQALELFQSWRPHLIWMDRHMQVMDGVKATRRIRELPGGKEVKIVAVTASAFTEQRNEMLKAGMDDIVHKPYRFNEIYECLTKQLGVQYTYTDTQAAEEVSNGVLTSQMLAVLPQDLRRELHDAVESLEGERITAVIGQVASYDSKLYKTLSYLAGNFDYPAILKALQTN